MSRPDDYDVGMWRLALLATAVIAVPACGGDDDAADGGGVADAAGADAGAADASQQDAGGRGDAGAALDAAERADTGTPGDCADDAHEEDDDVAQAGEAAPITMLAPPHETVLTDLVACPGDADLFHAYGDCCTPAGARITFAGGDLDLALVDEAGAPLAVDPADEVREPGRISLLRPEHGGAFFARVTNGGATPVAYELTLTARVFGP